jgi:formate transporter
MEKELDLLLPPEMAQKAEEVGVAKAGMSTTKTLMLAILAGAFIALGAMFSTVVTAGTGLPYGVAKLLGGVVFSLGLILVILGGAELFTGNSLIIMAWANRKVSSKQVLRNWLLVYVGNLAGALSMVVLILLSGHFLAGDGAVGLNMLKIAKAKCELHFINAIALGILCNILVCLAVWLCFSAKDVTGKIMAILFPVTAFVAAGFEHSIANMYFVPLGILLKNFGEPGFWSLVNSSPELFDSLTLHNFLLHNLLPVTIGNIIGGAGLVGGVYWFVFLKKGNGEG